MSKADLRQIAINAAAYREMLRQRESRERPGPTKTLRCRVVGIEGTYGAAHLLKRELSDEQRLGDLLPKRFRLALEGELTADDHDLMKALAELSRTGGSVTVRVEVGE